MSVAVMAWIRPTPRHWLGHRWRVVGASAVGLHKPTRQAKQLHLAAAGDGRGRGRLCGVHERPSTLRDVLDARHVQRLGSSQ